MTGIPLSPVTRWECPRCNKRDVTREVEPHTRFHTCPGMGGITAPMVREGERVKVETRMREDYVGREVVQTDDAGRPVMSVVTTREDGQDCTVYAPVASIQSHA